ncbi:MAG: hypothetical protein ACE5LU_29995 [Anaerolineae bacterium]
MMQILDLDNIGILDQVDPVEYLHDLARRQHEPGLLIQREPLAVVMKELGAKGISVPDPFEPYQIHLPLYIGATTPQAKSEVPHWHADQAEAYVLMEGEAELLARYRWDDDSWVRQLGRAGDVLVVQPEVCHWFRWLSADGLALVFKAPQRAGVGRFPAGKVVCKFCPHYKRGCVLPAGFASYE